MLSRRALLVFVPWMIAGCSSTGPYVWASQVQPSAPVTPRLRPGDRIQVVVFGQDAFSGEFEVRPGGEVVLPLSGSMTAEGLTPDALAAQVSERLKVAIASPRVTIVIASRPPAHVSVIGEVRTPGWYEVRNGEGVLDALARAGGLTAFADTDGIFVIRRFHGGQRVRFRYSDLTTADRSSMTFKLEEGDVVVVE